MRKGGAEISCSLHIKKEARGETIGGLGKRNKRRMWNKLFPSFPTRPVCHICLCLNFLGRREPPDCSKALLSERNIPLVVEQ